jgi:hypothetical protein
MRQVTRSKARGHQKLDLLTDDFLVRVAKDGRHLPIGKANGPRSIDHNHRIRGSIKNAARERCRYGLHLDA